MFYAYRITGFANDLTATAEVIVGRSPDDLLIEMQKIGFTQGFVLTENRDVLRKALSDRGWAPPPSEDEPGHFQCEPMHPPGDDRKSRREL